mmetsp:Transcript_56382/g.167795  ORF Transcript_56382/g.167795 Transcript_56382/m.167795 type:complete len:237 (-) Transcript_56382:29-739(-)
MDLVRAERKPVVRPAKAQVEHQVDGSCDLIQVFQLDKLDPDADCQGTSVQGNWWHMLVFGVPDRLESAKQPVHVHLRGVSRRGLRVVSLYAGKVLGDSRAGLFRAGCRPVGATGIAVVAAATAGPRRLWPCLSASCPGGGALPLPGSSNIVGDASVAASCPHPAQRQRRRRRCWRCSERTALAATAHRERGKAGEAPRRADARRNTAPSRLGETAGMKGGRARHRGEGVGRLARSC